VAIMMHCNLSPLDVAQVVLDFNFACKIWSSLCSVYKSPRYNQRFTRAESGQDLCKLRRVGWG